jgi:SlyX protein
LEAGMESPLNERVTELEVKSAFAEDMLDALNATVYRQQQQIDRLLREVRELREQSMAAAPAESGSLRDEIPPHY